MEARHALKLSAPMYNSALCTFVRSNLMSEGITSLLHVVFFAISGEINDTSSLKSFSEHLKNFYRIRQDKLNHLGRNSFSGITLQI